MSGRFLVVLALAAGIGSAAVAQDTTPIHLEPGAAGPSAGIHVQRGHVPAPRPAIAARGARHDGVEIAAVADLEFGIDDHRHGRDLGRFGRDRFRVPQHRPRRDRFIAPKHGFGRKHDFGRKRLGRGRHLEDRRSLGRRLRCDTAIGSSVLAFC